MRILAAGVEVLTTMRTLSGKTEADDMRSAIIQAEYSIARAIEFAHREDSWLRACPWWQNVMAESLQKAEANMRTAEARLVEMGEPRTDVGCDRSRANLGLEPYTGHMAVYMAEHLGAGS